MLEAQLDRFSFFKFDRPTGYAYQRVYSEDGRANVIVQARQHDVVTMPSGFYTLVSAPGTTTYTLNFLAGSSRAYAATPDSNYAWVADTLTAIDPRLPVVDPGHGNRALNAVPPFYDSLTDHWSSSGIKSCERRPQQVFLTHARIIVHLFE